MRLIASAAVIASFLLGSNAFIPSSQTRRVQSTTNALPPSLTFDLPSWLVEASSKVDNLSASASASTSPSNPELTQQVASLVSMLDLNKVNLDEPLSSISQQIASLIATLNLNQVNPDQPLSSILSAVAVPWHVEAIAAFAVANAFLYWLNSPDKEAEAPYEPGTSTYSPQLAAEFYGKRPLLVVKRILRLALLTGAFNSGLLFDWLVLGKLLRDEEYTALKKAEPRRAKAALRLCEKLGPTFIKLGQALSIRTDLVPEAYALELRQLQDAVPPFSSEEAYEVIRKQLGVSDLSEIFSSLSAEPVASASIGQAS